jgi:UDP-glucose 4-epimerase
LKILITGSSGFIGGYLVETFLKDGHHVVGLDNLSKYGKINRFIDNSQNYKLVIGDAKDSNLLFNLMKDVDYVIAGAAKIGGISYFHSFAYDLLAENEKIMAATCDAIIKHKKEVGKIQKVVYLSSSMVYENTMNWPSKEGDQLSIAPPTSSYGFQKLAVEYFAKAAWDQYQIPYTICRPFNCVGIGEIRAKSDHQILSGNIKLALSHVVPDLIQKIYKKQFPVRILGNGNQIRHYTFGKDLAEGIKIATFHPKAFNEDFNISTKESTTVNSLVSTIWEKLNPGKNLEISYDESFAYDVQKRIPDVSKSLNLLGFEATTSLDKMLDEVIPWITNAIDLDLI